MPRSRRFYAILAAILILTITGGALALNWYFNQNQYGPGPIDILVTTQKPGYLPGEDVYFVIYVTNPQDWPVTHPDFASYQISKNGEVFDGGSVNIDFVSPIPTFPPHSTTTYNPPLLWNQQTEQGSNQTQAQPDNYTLTVTLKGYEYSASGNCTFKILNPLPPNQSVGTPRP